MSANHSKKYRKDIDGLRAVAVMAVILFHLGYLPNGYLGVDVFFVISGFLITNIIYTQSLESRFSMLDFYIRRTRRIIPLVLFVNLVALVIGIIVMLPDDLDNLAQSVVATNFFGNNILEFFTSKDYWALVNDYKPLMHTWSLGIEEQYYVIYPFLFIAFSGKKTTWILPIILVLSIISLVFYFIQDNAQAKFYLLQYRFFELALGGLGTIVMRSKLLNPKWSFLFLPLLVFFLYFQIGWSPRIDLIATIILTLGLLLTRNSANTLTSLFLENKVMIFLGKISFSLYMWHQLMLAYTRYFIIEEYTAVQALFIVGAIILVSYFSYTYIEEPFRRKNRIGDRIFYPVLLVLFLITTATAGYLVYKGGVIKDVKELGIAKNDPAQRNTHVQFNMSFMTTEENKSFSDEEDKLKVLIIGNSYSRDWGNVLLLSDQTAQIDLAYIQIAYDYSEEINAHGDLIEKWNTADRVFISVFERQEFDEIIAEHRLDPSKVLMIGNKNFCVSNGIFYNKSKNNANYCNQRATVREKHFIENEKWKSQYPGQYVDILGTVTNENRTVPVFNNDCQFLSQDCDHLLRAGALYLSRHMPISRYLQRSVSEK